jgi:hypothetical protein
MIREGELSVSNGKRVSELQTAVQQQACAGHSSLLCNFVLFPEARTLNSSLE